MACYLGVLGVLRGRNQLVRKVCVERFGSNVETAP